MGKIKISSTSKIRKIREIEKNRIEKGRREENLGLNPHSKGLILSLSDKDLNLQEKPKKSNAIASKKTKRKNTGKKIKNIIFFGIACIFVVYKT